MIKKHGSTILLVCVFITGLFLLLYPSFSDWWNSRHQTQAIAGYREQVEELDHETYGRLLRDAEDYNAALAARPGSFLLSEAEQEEYENLLNPMGTGIMGYVEIPRISATLPIYHGTDESVLQVAAGHIPGSSLPVGGESSHCVLSSHRGLPSARLFTDLDEMVAGDLFLLHVLDETLTYEVDQILIVEPYDVQALGIVEGMDYCTLVTCTPYGINTHRLLVRGHRVENQREEIIVTADAAQIRPVTVAPVVAVLILTVLILSVLIRRPKRRK